MSGLTPVFAVLEGGQVRNAMPASAAAAMMAEELVALFTMDLPTDEAVDVAVAKVLSELKRMSLLQSGSTGHAVDDH